MASILVVDDDHSVRHFTARALMIDGHEVDQADDGDVALDALRMARTGVVLLVDGIEEECGHGANWLVRNQLGAATGECPGLRWRGKLGCR